jgi:hypothetical protein
MATLFCGLKLRLARPVSYWQFNSRMKTRNISYTTLYGQQMIN